MNLSDKKITPFTPVLTIAGSDNSGGAGVQADLKTFSALGCYGLSTVTAITAQSSDYFLRYVAITPQMVYDQITLSIRQSRPLALKTGMLAAEDIIYTIAEAVMEYNLQNLIIDPVLKSSSGSLLNAGSFSGKSGDNFSRCLLEELISQCLVVTPNRAEAETLSGVKIESYHDVELASKKLIEMGAKYVIIKGGHLDFDPDFSIDTVYFRNGMEKISSPRLISGNFHGTGCTFSAALCAFIAQGFDVITAARNAKRYVFCAMEQANPENPGILNHQCDFVPEI